MDLIVSEVTKHESSFMDLPTEVREIIYRHLVIANFTKREHNMRSREFNRQRNYLLTSPDQTHQFFPAIFCTSRKVHEELIDLCQRENDFVCFISHCPSNFTERLDQYGLELIARGPKARDFWNISMTLTLNPAEFDSLPQSHSFDWQTTDTIECSEDNRAEKYIFCSDELPIFCRLVLSTSIEGRLLQDMTLCIGINPAIWKVQAMDMDSSPAGRSRQQKLLEPLCQLHGFGNSFVEGPLSGTYKDSICRSVCNDCPTAFEIIFTALDIFTQGNEWMGEGHFLRANHHYKQALNYADSCCWRYGEENFITEEEPFPGLTAAQVLANLRVRLQARISLMYLKSGMSRMARIYTERALDPRRAYDDRFNKTDSLELEPWEEIVYAEALLVSAEISGIHGQVKHAIRDMRKAKSYIPLDQEQQYRYDSWNQDMDKINEKSHHKCCRTSPRHLIERKKAEDMLQVVCNRKTKGDQLLRSGRSYLAASRYQAALSKLELLEQTYPDSFAFRTTTYEGYDLPDAINVLTFKLYGNIAAACLMSQKYEEVDRWTDTALNCNHDEWNCPHQYIYRCSHGDWKAQYKLDYLKIHYCKAMARKHMGDGVGALEHMEKALTFDPGDNTVYTQLLLLKEI